MPNRRIKEVIGERPFPTLAPDTSIQSAAIMMKSWNASAVLVIDKNKLMGILTERDIVRRLVAISGNAANVLVSSIMTRDVRTIHQDKPFGHALHMMYEGGFRHVPVLDDRGTPVGLLAAHDALDIDGLQMHEDLVRREEITVIL